MNHSLPQSDSSVQIVVYQPNSKTNLPFRREVGETYGTQKEIAALFDISVPTVNEHIANFQKADPETYSRSIRKFRIVAAPFTVEKL